MFKMLLNYIFHCKVVFIQIFILLVFDKIFITESASFKNPFENSNFDIEINIPIAPTVQSEKFLQKLDHFNPTDGRTWKQVYYFEKSYYKSGGPVYLWIGGQGRVSPKWLQEGYFRTNGEKNKAMFFLVEHRYYGDSQPQKDTATEHLTYLTTEQALADLASFIVSMNKEHRFPAETKWIVFGGSYAGNLAAWMRLKYPHLVHGAVASSAPVLAQFNFPEYWDGVGNALESYKKECRRDVAAANQRLDKMVRSTSGRKQIGKVFKLCTPLSGRRMDVSYLLESMAYYFAVSVEFDRSGRDIKAACDKVLESSCHLDQLTRYAAAVKMLMNKYGGSCLPTNSTQFVEYMKKNDYETSAKSARAKWYQTCTEYGHYQTIRRSNNTFSKRITLDFASGWCSKVFHTSFNKKFISQAVDDTNQSFGGLKINAARVLFIHGTLDPWLALGVSHADKRNNFNVILIKGGSHCSDLRASNEEDSKDLKDARSKVTNLIDKWLQKK